MIFYFTASERLYVTSELGLVENQNTLPGRRTDGNKKVAGSEEWVPAPSFAPRDPWNKGTRGF
jgi:hypothetical protein